MRTPVKPEKFNYQILKRVAAGDLTVANEMSEEDFYIREVHVLGRTSTLINGVRCDWTYPI